MADTARQQLVNILIDCMKQYAKGLYITMRTDIRNNAVGCVAKRLIPVGKSTEKRYVYLTMTEDWQCVQVHAEHRTTHPARPDKRHLSHTQRLPVNSPTMIDDLIAIVKQYAVSKTGTAITEKGKKFIGFTLP